MSRLVTKLNYKYKLCYCVKLYHCITYIIIHKSVIISVLSLILRFPFSVLSDVETHCLEKVMPERLMPLETVTTNKRTIQEET